MGSVFSMASQDGMSNWQRGMGNIYSNARLVYSNELHSLKSDLLMLAGNKFNSPPHQ